MTLKSLRKSKGLFVTQIAQRLGVSAGYVSHIENGVRKVSDDLLLRLSKAYEEHPDVIADCIRNIGYPSALQNSWVSQVKINGLPLVRAFKHHAITLDPPIDWQNEREVFLAMSQFVTNNITQSLAATFGEKEELLPQLIHECTK